jgi:hypothetical protein
LHGKLREDHEGGDDDHGGRRGVRVLEIPAAALAEARAAEPSVPHFVSMVSIYLSCEMWQRQNNQ